MINVSDIQLAGNEAKYVKKCIDEKWFSSKGLFVSQFEDEFSKYIGVKHSITCNSGTSGLYAAVKALGIDEGDEIIIPNFTIIVSASVIIQNNLKPVIVEVEEDTCCINPLLIEKSITTKTKAIMIVHMYGQPCDMEEINRIAKKYNLFIIEDCCQAIGAKYMNRNVGNFCDVAVFSFYANKLITTGEGGMIVTNSDVLASQIRLIINNGFDIPRFKHNILGHNFLMSNIQAAVGLSQLEKIDSAIKKKKIIEQYYDHLLSDFSDFLVFPQKKNNSERICWMYNLRIKDNLTISKDRIISLMLKRGIECRSYYYGMHEQPVFKTSNNKFYPLINDNFEISSKLSNSGFYIPSGLALTNKQQEIVASTLLEIIINESKQTDNKIH